MDRLTVIADQIFGEWYPGNSRSGGIMVRHPRAVQLATAEIRRMEAHYGRMDPDVRATELDRLIAEYANLLREKAPLAA